ncbi:MAG TPA: GNAT family N-acetyltransferase [Bryobacteraceae bacterium]|nr:GNAT family N-acetyltransferase [Bryobacteraceae bacterium]
MTSAGLFIRDYHKRDEAALQSMVEVSITDEDIRDHAHFGERETGPTYARTIVAEEAGRCIGFASAFQNPFHHHPVDFRFSVVVDPPRRRRGLGTALYHALLQSTLPGRRKRLRCVTAEEDATAAAFLKTLGYRVLLTSYIAVLEVAAVNPDELAGNLHSLERDGYRFLTLADIESDPQRDARISELCLEAYADGHPLSPPTGPPARWQEAFLGVPCVREAFFVAIQGDRYVAFSSLRPGKVPGVLEAMWDGVARTERALEFPLRLALKTREVQYARSRAVNELHWEVDSTDLNGMHLLKVLPFGRRSGACIWVNEP